MNDGVTQKAGNIHEAIARVMEEIGYIQKGKSPTGGVTYTFLREDQIIESLRPILLRHGIITYPAEATESSSERYVTKNGGSMALVRIKIRWVWHHWPSGTQINVETISEAADSGDKASSKAHTIGLKYSLRQTLLIQTGDDPDNEANERASKTDAERIAKRSRMLADAKARLMAFQTAEEIQRFLEHPTIQRYQFLLSEVRIMASRRIRELAGEQLTPGELE